MGRCAGGAHGGFPGRPGPSASGTSIRRTFAGTSSWPISRSSRTIAGRPPAPWITGARPATGKPCSRGWSCAGGAGGGWTRDTAAMSAAGVSVLSAARRRLRLERAGPRHRPRGGGAVSGRHEAARDRVGTGGRPRGGTAGARGRSAMDGAAGAGPVTPRGWRNGATRRSTPTTGSWRAPWNASGTTRSATSSTLSASTTTCGGASGSSSLPTIAPGSWHWPRTSRRSGTRQRPRMSSGRICCGWWCATSR
jgi:hypothetical protein